MNAKTADQLGNELKRLVQLGQVHDAVALLEPVLAERTPFRYLDRVGNAIDVADPMYLDRFVELITLNTPFAVMGASSGHDLTIRAGVTSTAAGTCTVSVAEGYMNVDDGTTWDIAAGSKVIALTGGTANGLGGFRFAGNTLTKTGEGTLAVGGGGWRNWDTSHGMWNILDGTVELTPHPDSTNQAGYSKSR